MSEINRVYLDVGAFAGRKMTLHLDNDLLSKGAAFDNVLGVYFEYAGGTIIPNSGIVIYPKTNYARWGIERYPEEFIEIDIPMYAYRMGYWIASDAGPHGNRNYNIEFERFDVIDIRKDGVATQGFTTKDYQGQKRDWLGFDSDGKNILSDPYPYTVYADTMIRCHGWANVFKMSNPDHNLNNFEWFIFEEDGSVLVEDLAYNTGWDFGIWWTRPRKSLCDFSLHPGCPH